MLLLKSIRGFRTNRSLTWLACVPVALFGLGIFNLSAHAAELPDLNAAFLANNLWLLVATILVIFMNAGFAMVEAGMCRQKNAVNILAKNLFVFALAVTAYWFIGFSLMYGNAFWEGILYYGKGGAFGLFFDPTVTPDMVKDGSLVPSVDFLFQAAFAGTAATIVSGLVAERVKFGEFVIFALVLTAFIYPISGSWQWNGDGWLAKLGFIDFAGSSIVHSVGAWAGLVGAMLLGPRIGKFVNGKPQAIPGHNMGIATLGALILWIGWYGFNPGSVLGMDETVAYVAVTTTLAAAVGAIAATVPESRLSPTSPRNRSVRCRPAARTARTPLPGAPRASSVGTRASRTSAGTGSATKQRIVCLLRRGLAPEHACGGSTGSPRASSSPWSPASSCGSTWAGSAPIPGWRSAS